MVLLLSPPQSLLSVIFHAYCCNNYAIVELRKEEYMIRKASVQRYYIRDSETNELWCFDSRFIAG